LRNFENVIKKINIVKKDGTITLEVELEKANFDFNRGTKVRKFRKQHAAGYLVEQGHNIGACLADGGLIGNIEVHPQKGVWKFELISAKKASPLPTGKKTKKMNKEE
jgi:hypothetical protein